MTAREPYAVTAPPSPLFSVVIPTFNRAHMIGRAVGSVLAQSWNDFEVVVVDDGSIDETAEVLSSMEDPRIVHSTKPHSGVCDTRNEGARIARGDYLVFLDSDDWAFPNWLETFSESLQTSQPDLLICGMEAVDSEGTSRWEWSPPSERIDDGALVVHFESGQVAIRRSLFERSGGFATQLSFGENTELAIRLLFEQPVRPSVLSVPAVLVRVRPAGAERDYTRDRAVSAQYVIDRHPSLRHQLPALWASYHAIVGADLIRHGAAPAARRCFLEALVMGRRMEHAKRLAASLFPPLANGIWPLEGHEGSSPQATTIRAPEVLFVALASGLGGSMRSLATLLNHLEGIRRTVACPGPSPFTDLLDAEGSYERRLMLPSERRARLLARATAAMTLAIYAHRNRTSLMAIHANGLSDRLVASLAAAVTGLPIVVWVHEWTVSPWSRRTAPLLKRLERRTRYAAVSRQSRDMLIASGIARPDQIDVVANPIDPDQVRVDRHESRVQERECTVGYVGAPASYKGFQLLPELIRALDGEGIAWVVYSGPRSAMTEVWDELHALEGPKVHLKDKVVDVKEAYACFDIVLCPSFEESFGRVVAEAMINRIPVVASDLPPLRDLVGEEDAGLLFSPGSIEEAAIAIRRLAADPSWRQRMGRKGMERAIAFEPDRIAEQMRRLYSGS